MTIRLDIALIQILEGLGPIWFVVALCTLLFFVVAPLRRTVVAAVFMLVATQMWFGPFYFISRNLRWWVLGIVCVRGLLYIAKSKRPAGESRGVHRVLGALVTMALASAFWSDDATYAGALAASFAVGIILTFGIVWRLLDDEVLLGVFVRGVTAFALFIFGMGFVIAAMANYLDIGILIGITGTELGDRYQGLFINPNVAGVLGAILLPIVLAAPRSELRGLARFRWITVALIAASIYFSGSRSALLGSVFSTVVLALYKWGGGAFISMAVAGVILLVTVVYAPLEHIDESAVGHISRTEQLADLSGRFQLWEEGWNAAKDTLVFGKGWGENRALEGGKEGAIEHGGMQGGTNLHNAHLQLLIDLGVVGVALFWTFCLMVLAAGWKILRGHRTHRSALTIVIFASVVAMMADTVAHGWVFSTGSPSTLVFWGFCAMVIKEVDITRRTTFYVERPVRPDSRPPAHREPALAG